MSADILVCSYSVSLGRKEASSPRYYFVISGRIFLPKLEIVSKFLLLATLLQKGVLPPIVPIRNSLPDQIYHRVAFHIPGSPLRPHFPIWCLPSMARSNRSLCDWEIRIEMAPRHHPKNVFRGTHRCNSQSEQDKSECTLNRV
jgi:hypothetical protein